MATIKDVAELTGLSIGTVSRVLNNRGYISQKTRKKVDDAMKKLNYQPNAIARSLSKSSSNIIGVILPLLDNPFFASLLSGIENELESRGYQLLLFISDGDGKKESELLRECKRNRVAGIVLCSGNFEAMRISDLDVPVVSIERSRKNSSVSIECDNYKGGGLACRHLYQVGARNIVYVYGAQDYPMPADARQSGFEDACRELGLETRIYKADSEDFHQQDYFELLARVFDENPGMDGLFCSSDMIAAQALKMASKRGIAVPEELKIVGFDDSIIAVLTTPELTTIHQPVDEMASLAVGSLLSSIKTSSFSSTSVVVDVHLVERGSTVQAI